MMLIADRLRIVMASSEAVPFSKTGGLADVATALSIELDAMGHDVTLIIPDYRAVRAARSGSLPEVSDSGMRVTISMNGRSVKAAVHWATLPDTGVRVLLISQPSYFDRPALYMEHGEGYPDNCERFCFFSRAVPEICRQMVLRPDVVHCNDWQTGLIPALLHSRYPALPGFERTATVMTLHNMAFQGRFWHLDMALTGMDWKYFNHRQMECWGDLNLLKTGIAFADGITTVSPTYAEEVCSPEGGFGLDSVLLWRRDDLTGILNGIDTSVWNPETDPNLAMNFSAGNPQPGKNACKAALQNQLGLEIRESTPLIGMVSRMSDQKGFDLITACADEVMHRDVQLVFLGTGDPHFEDEISRLAMRYPGRVAAVIGFDDTLAHQIEAGSDMFLMPSRFEPCGLNQMYSLRYGSVPIVRRVGGLADSVTDTTEDTLKAGTATGFVFSEYDPSRLLAAINRALDTFERPTVWEQIRRTGMTADWSWQNSARRYDAVYRRASERRLDRQIENRC